MSKQILLALSALLAFAGIAAAQPYSCVASVPNLPTVRGSGIAEYVGDLLVTCTGGSQSLGTSSINVTISLNTNITTRLDANGITEAIAFVDDPGPGNRAFNQNVFKGSLTAPNAVTFTGIAQFQPGPGSRTYRFTNIRANATQLAQNVPVAATISASMFAGSTTSNPVNTVALVQPGRAFDVRTCDDSQPAAPNFSPLSPQNPGLVNGNSYSGAIQFNVRFSEALASGFRPMGPTQDPSPVPVLYGITESGFVDTAILGRPTGIATQGTRLLAKFNNIPTGVHLFVTTAPIGAGGASSPNLTATFTLADANGAGPPSQPYTYQSGTCAASNTSALIQEIPVSGGAAQAVWEVTGSDPAAIEKASFGVVVAYASPPLPGSGTATAGGSTAPVSTVITSSSTEPAPRFATINTTQPAFSIGTATPLTITTANPLPAGQVGVPYSLPSFSAVGGLPPYIWSSSITQPPPPLLTLGSNGAFTGTPSTAGPYSFLVRVTDALDTTVSATFTMNIGAAPSITTPSPLPPGQVGSPYSIQFTQAGVNQPVWTITGGAPPSGFTFSNSGLLAVTPTTPGAYNFNVSVTNSNPAIPQSASKSFSLTIAAPVPSDNTVSITTRSIANGVLGAQYSQTLTAVGGSPPYTWSADAPNLPPGISLSSSGVLSGIPANAGAFRVIVRVSDIRGSGDGVVFPITITGPPLLITTASLSSGTVGSAYSQSIQITGGVPPVTFGIASGSLPVGLTFSPGGTIAGTPTGIGTSTFTVQATDSAQGRDTHVFSVAVAANPLTVTTTSLPNGTVTVPYSQSVAASGGSPPYTFTISSGSLPSGLTLSSAGAITGIPSAVGDSTFTIQATDRQNQTAAKSLTLRIVSLPIVTTASPLPVIVTGAASSLTLAASGGTVPYSWSITGGSLPAGLTLDAGTGAIAGTPTAAGPYSFTATVTDANKLAATKPFTGRVSTPVRITTAPTLPVATVGTAYSQKLDAAGGTPPYIWSAADALPAGLTLDPVTGIISGTPATPADGSFNIDVFDADRLTARTRFSLTENLPQLTGVTIGGVPDTPPPGQQSKVTVTLGNAFPLGISGTVTLSFASDAAVPADDPAIQFSTGGRTAAFTIPAGSTQAAFSVTDLAIQTGTVSGAITLTTALQSGTTPVTCNCALTRTIRIAKSAPVISSVGAARVANGLNITIIGFSTTRELTQVTFQFVGNNLQTTSFTVPLTSSFTTWYQSPQSAQFGSQFLLTEPFTIQGDPNAVTSVSVTLANAQGTSQPVTATVQ